MQHSDQLAGTAYPMGQHPVAVSPPTGYFAALPAPSRWTFTQGLIVGQVSMVIIALLLIRYVIFEDSATALEKERLMRLKISERRSKRHAKQILRGARRAATTATSSGVHPPLQNSNRISSDARASTFANILHKTAYDISSHLAESTDWLNVVFAQAIAGYREDVLAGGVSSHPPSHHDHDDHHHHHDTVRHGTPGIHFGTDPIEPPAHPLEPEKERTARDLMEEILNRVPSSFLDPIRVTEADFGDAYPIFTNARVRPADDTGRTRIEIDVDYSDQITLAIDTKLLINFPKPRFAVLPISLSLTIVRFSGTISVELFSSDPNATFLPTAPASSPSKAAHTPPRSRHQLHFSLHPDFALEASATSLLGSRAKLQDIPKIEQLLISRLRGWILDRFVWPRYWSLTLPNLVPSPAAANSRNTAHGVEAYDAQLGMNGHSGEGPADSPAAPGEMKVDTGVERNDDSIVQPGHLESTRQEMLHSSASDAPAHALSRPPHPRSSSSHLGMQRHSGLSMPSGIGSVEAWRVHTAGVYSQPSHQHATSLTQAALLRANGGASGGTDSGPGSDLHIEVPGSFRGSVAGAGIGLASSTASSSLPAGAHTASNLRNRPGFVH